MHFKINCQVSDFRYKLTPCGRPTVDTFQMNEDWYSINARLKFEGFDTQLSMRSDESWEMLLGDFNEALRTIQAAGGGPTVSASPRPGTPHCPDHRKGEPSKNGAGLYCPTRVNGGWCDWSDKLT